RRHVRWFPAMVGNHIAELVQKHHSGDVPPDLAEYIRGREGYDYRQHADKDSAHLGFISDAIVDRFAVVGTVADHVAKLKELSAAGVHQFNLYLMNDDEERTLNTY